MTATGGLGDAPSAVAPVRPSVTGSLWAVRILAPLGALALTVTVLLAVLQGAPLGAEGAAIAAIWWGRVSFVDLGLALVTGWGWIAWREASVPRALVWLVLCTLTGSVAILGYLTGAAWRHQRGRDVLVGPRRA
jgi:hypothetical protein